MQLGRFENAVAVLTTETAATRVVLAEVYSRNGRPDLADEVLTQHILNFISNDACI